ncbi:MAG: methylated-DNA--[protein]-cysteine S-methyltransferase [Ferruginibacter sp.]
MNETIYYDSPVGLLRIKNEGDALSEIIFIKTEDQAEIKKLKKSITKPTTPILKKCTAQLDDYFSGKNLQFDLPIVQEGTPFQQRVWKGLLTIPKGKTLSYLQFSKQLGNEKAIRAVGTANGKNNVSIIVPCHRVIGSNGMLVGYGGGLWRKQWLLNHEAKYCNGVQTMF